MEPKNEQPDARRLLHRACVIPNAFAVGPGGRQGRVEGGHGRGFHDPTTGASAGFDLEQWM